MTADQVRAEVVGSLLRPAYLMEARQRLLAGELPMAEFIQAEDQAVDEAIALQERLGFTVVTDGEMRRMETYFDPVGWHVSEVAPVPGPDIVLRDDDGNTEVNRSEYSVAGRIRTETTFLDAHYGYARARANVPVKVTVPAPFSLAIAWTPDVSGAVYADPWQMFLDGAAAMKTEISKLVADGCTQIQIDAPELTHIYCGEQVMLALMHKVGLPARRAEAEAVEVINDMVADLPADVQVSMHLCRANYRSKWWTAGDYAPLTQAVFSRASNVDRFLLDYETPDACGGFDPLKNLPDDKSIVLGLVSSKRDRLEDPDLLVAAIDAASRHVGKDRLGISTQCGFASAREGNLITPATQEAKLRLVVELADRIWN